MAGVSAGVGHSRAADAGDAGTEAAARASADAGEDIAVGFAFASSEYDQPALVGAIDDELACPVVGCSTAGEIAGGESYTESVVVLALAGDVDVGVGLAGIADDAYEQLGREAVSGALDDLDRDPLSATLLSRDGAGGWTSVERVATTLFGDGFFDDEAAILAGVQDVLGGTAVGGAWAGDDWKYEATWTYADGEPSRGTTTATVLDAGVRTGIGSATGLRPTDQEFTVTDAADRVVYELDGRPALDVYREAFGDAVDSFQFLLTRPMGYDLGGDEPSVFVPGPSPFEGDPDTAMHVTGAVEEDWTVSVLDTSVDAVLSGARDAAEGAMADAGHPDDVAAVLVYDCMCRWYHLSDAETRSQEARIVRDVVGEDVPVAGFYSYGEVHSPGPMSGARNQSIVVQVISDEPLPGADQDPSTASGAGGDDP